MVPEPEFAAMYRWALGYARRKATSQEAAETLIDAATDGLMWARARCDSPERWRNYARSTVYRVVNRAIKKLVKREHRRPGRAALPEQLEAKPTCRPPKPNLIADLPEELAFLVRLYMVDGYTNREIGLLTGQSHNTVNLKLRRAAALLQDGLRVEPRRRNGEKRLSRG